MRSWGGMACSSDWAIYRFLFLEFMTDKIPAKGISFWQHFAGNCSRLSKDTKARRRRHGEQYLCPQGVVKSFLAGNSLMQLVQHLSGS